jgi:D-amino-acid dehydrogenase
MEAPGSGSSPFDMGSPSSGASWGNAGWLSPSLCLPLNAPGTVAKALRWMLRSDSPLYIRPAPDLRLMAWLFDFWRHCNVSEYRRAVAAIATLAAEAPGLYEELRAGGVTMEMRPADVLSLFLSEKTASEFDQEMKLMEAFGYVSPELLSRSDLASVEPHVGPDVRAGVVLRGQHYVRPDSLIAGLARRVRAMGATIRTAERIVSLSAQKDQLVAALTESGGRIEADEFLLCAGAWSPGLTSGLRIRLPIRPGRGYSITLINPSFSLSGLTNLEEGRVVCTPMIGRLRFSGTMEFSPLGRPSDRRRLEAIRRTVSRFFDQWPNGESEVEWSGPRPMTSDSLPVIGKAPAYRNLFLATGHGMLGMLLAPPTAVAIAELMTEGMTRFDIRPFDPARF